MSSIQEKPRKRKKGYVMIIFYDNEREIKQKFKSFCALKGINMSDKIKQFMTQTIKENERMKS